MRAGNILWRADEALDRALGVRTVHAAEQDPACCVGVSFTRVPVKSTQRQVGRRDGRAPSAGS